ALANVGDRVGDQRVVTDGVARRREQLAGDVPGRVVRLGVRVGDGEDGETERAVSPQVMTARGGSGGFVMRHRSSTGVFVFESTRTGPSEVEGYRPRASFSR